MASGGDAALKICSLREVVTPGISKFSVSGNLPIPSLHAQHTCLNILVFRPLLLLASLIWLGWFIQINSPGLVTPTPGILSWGKRRRGRALEGRFQTALPVPFSSSHQWLTFIGPAGFLGSHTSNPGLPPSSIAFPMSRCLQLPDATLNVGCYCSPWLAYWDMRL